MIRVQKPMMLAYIIFLSICIAYHSVAGILDLEFSAWNRIVVAATIASYFFSLSSLNKQIAKQEKSNIESFSEESLLLKKIYDREQKLTESKKVKPELLQHIEEAIRDSETRITEGHKSLKKSERGMFWKDVLGFLAFFCILSFDGIYMFFLPFQDACTLGALLIVISIEYIESTKVVYYEELKRITMNSTKDLLTKLEEEDNG